MKYHIFLTDDFSMKDYCTNLGIKFSPIYHDALITSEQAILIRIKHPDVRMKPKMRIRRGL